MLDLHNRRAFLRAAAAAGVAWAAADFSEIENALAWAGQQAAAPAAPTTALTRVEAEAVTAIAARIIPAVDGRPGAGEAGAIFFIDRALATFNQGAKKLYAAGIADVNRRAARIVPGAAFAALSPAPQDDILRAIEKSEFFQAVRFDTIVGTFGLPALGGNRDHLGWQIIGFDHQPRFQAPFGYYDAEANRRS